VLIQASQCYDLGDNLKMQRILPSHSDDFPERIDLPYDYPKPITLSNRFARYTTQLEASLLQELKTVGQNQQSSLMVALLSGLSALLYRYSQQETLVIGLPIRVTEQSAGDELVIRAFRANVKSDLTFEELLAQVRVEHLESTNTNQYPHCKSCSC